MALSCASSDLKYAKHRSSPRFTAEALGAVAILRRWLFRSGMMAE
jgi:hypothetical protein